MKTLRRAILAAAAALIAAQLPAAQTNLVQNLNIQFLAFSPGLPTTNDNVISWGMETSKITSRDIISALGAATGTTFSPLATLMAVKPLPDGEAQVVVFDQGRRVVVTRFFAHEQPGESAGRGRLNTTTGLLSGTEISYHHFAQRDTATETLSLHYRVNGLAIVSYISLLRPDGGVIGAAYEYSVPVGGTGDLNGKPIVLQGTITGKGRRVEIIP